MGTVRAGQGTGGGPGCGADDSGGGAPPDEGGEGAANGASWEAYDRRDHGLRLRTCDPERDQAVRQGLQTITDILTEVRRARGAGVAVEPLRPAAGGL